MTQRPRPLAVGVAIATVVATAGFALAVQPTASVADPNVKAECAPGQLRSSAILDRVADGEPEKRTPEQIIDAVLNQVPEQASLTSRPKRNAFTSAARRDIVVSEANGTAAAVFFFTDIGNGLELESFQFCSTASAEDKRR